MKNFTEETGEDENVLMARFHSEKKRTQKVILSIFSSLSFHGSLVGGENRAHGERECTFCQEGGG